MPLRYGGLEKKDRLKMGRTLSFLAATILFLVFSVWYNSGALNLKGVAGGILDFVLIALLLGSFFGASLSFVYSLAQRKWSGAKTFAAENDFRYEEMPKEDTPVLALLFPEKFNASTNFIISGNYTGRLFAVRLVTLGNKTYPPGRGFYGLLGLGLKSSYGHVVVDSGDQYWKREDAQPTTLMSGRQVYLLDGTADLPGWLGEFIDVTKVGGEFAIEIQGDRLYILEKNGLSLTPEGMQRMFGLIEKIDVFDK